MVVVHVCTHLSVVMVVPLTTKAHFPLKTTRSLRIQPKNIQLLRTYIIFHGVSPHTPGCTFNYSSLIAPRVHGCRTYITSDLFAHMKSTRPLWAAERKYVRWHGFGVSLLWMLMQSVMGTWFALIIFPCVASIKHWFVPQFPKICVLSRISDLPVTAR